MPTSASTLFGLQILEPIGITDIVLLILVFRIHILIGSALVKSFPVVQLAVAGVFDQNDCQGLLLDPEAVSITSTAGWLYSTK